MIKIKCFIVETNNGTFTGNALRFVRNTLFAERNGNRPGSQDVILLITDGRAQDDVETISRQLRDNGVLVSDFEAVVGLGNFLILFKYFCTKVQ